MSSTALANTRVFRWGMHSSITFPTCFTAFHKSHTLSFTFFTPTLVYLICFTFIVCTIVSHLLFVTSFVIAFNDVSFFTIVWFFIKTRINNFICVFWPFASFSLLVLLWLSFVFTRFMFLMFLLWAFRRVSKFTSVFIAFSSVLSATEVLKIRKLNFLKLLKLKFQNHIQVVVRQELRIRLSFFFII